MNTTIIIADYHNPQHCGDITRLMNHYAQDPMGGGTPLSEFTQQHLCAKLAALPHALTLLGYVNQQAVGLITCFEGFSTFTCKPLLNIHDVIVLDSHRNQGICQLMLRALENIAIKKGCCKLTLEVLEGNQYAQLAYKNFGFKGYELDPAMGQALFWEKPLS